MSSTFARDCSRVCIPLPRNSMTELISTFFPASMLAAAAPEFTKNSDAATRRPSSAPQDWSTAEVLSKTTGEGTI